VQLQFVSILGSHAKKGNDDSQAKTKIYLLNFFCSHTGLDFETIFNQDLMLWLLLVHLEQLAFLEVIGENVLTL
jgi:hypothetical protein